MPWVWGGLPKKSTVWGGGGYSTAPALHRKVRCCASLPLLGLILNLGTVGTSCRVTGSCTAMIMKLN